jgi:Hint domain
MANTATVYTAGTQPTLGVDVLNLQQALTSNKYLNTGELTFTGGTITFGGVHNSGNNGASGDAGVYNGTISGIADAPNSSGSTAYTGNFLAAEKSSSVTISFTTTQEYFGILWGSLDSFNTLTFNLVGGGTYTITGTQAAALITGGSTNGSTSYYVGFSIPGGYTSVVASSTSNGFEFANIAYSTNATPPTGTPTTIAVTPTIANSLCLLGGTAIATPQGERLIETLQIGDLVTLSDGGVAPVRWVGRQTVATRFADPMRNLPIRIRANALGENLPVRDLLVSPDHALAIDGILIQAAALVNDVTIVREDIMPERFTWYHVELASHALILAENVPAETFIDNVDRLAFDNWAEHETLYSHAEPLHEMELPRAKSARQIPAATRAKLAALAGLADESAARAA